MKNFLLFALSIFVLQAGARWYWPFGSDDGKKSNVRLSEIMKPASLLIDDASDLASDGKSQEAIEKYRAALAELDRIEQENPDRAESVEFATVRNKRAYVNAAIDSLLLGQVQQNAKAVAVSDTTELEKKFSAEKAAKKDAAKTNAVEKVSGKADAKTNVVSKVESKTEVMKVSPAPAAASGSSQTFSPREQAMRDIENKDFDAALLVIEAMLVEKPNSAAALNLKARAEFARGRPAEAEAALDQAIMSNPRGYHAYYNMARLMLGKNPPNVSGARRYYETGRAVGGPEDAELEAKFK